MPTDLSVVCASGPLYTLVIPAYNEEVWLPKCLEAVGQAMVQEKRPGEVIVVDNNSTDATGRLARELGTRVVFEPVNQISRARNTGAAAAKGRYLIFLDADTLLPPALLKATLDALESGSCCGGGSLLSFDRNNNLLGNVLARIFSHLSERYHLAPGGYFFCTREAFEALGGFSLKLYASEEIRLSRQMKKWGKKQGQEFRILKENPVLTSARKLDQMGLIVFTLVVGILFPFAVYFRSLCRLWYKRYPEKPPL